MALTRLLEDYIRAQPNRALGGVRAFSGFEYQIRSYLADFAQGLADGCALHEAGEGFAHALEALSDHTRQDGDLTVCVQVKRTLTTSTLADAAAEFALVDEFLQSRLEPGEHAKVRYECVARSGDAALGWDGARLPGKVTSTHPGLQARFDGLRLGWRLLPPRIERDPWWRLIASVYRQLEDPFAFARKALDLCWIDGRSGSGKSVLLLQLMASLVREGARVLWLRDRGSELLGLLHSIELNAPIWGPELVFVDEPRPPAPEAGVLRPRSDRPVGPRQIASRRSS